MEKSIFANKLVIRFAHNWGGILVHSSLQKLSKSFKTQNQLPPHIFCNVLPLSILPWRYVLDHCHTGRLLFSVPAEEGRLASKIGPKAQCFHAWLYGWCSLCHTQHFSSCKHGGSTWCQRAWFFISGVIWQQHFSQAFFDSFRCSVANLWWACTCAFLNRGPARI